MSAGLTLQRRLIKALTERFNCKVYDHRVSSSQPSRSALTIAVYDAGEITKKNYPGRLTVEERELVVEVQTRNEPHALRLAQVETVVTQVMDAVRSVSGSGLYWIRPNGRDDAQEDNKHMKRTSLKYAAKFEYRMGAAHVES